MFNSPVVNWIIAGLMLSLLELIVPGVYLIWFGFAAFIVGITVYFLPLEFTTQLIIFAIASVFLPLSAWPYTAMCLTKRKYLPNIKT